MFAGSWIHADFSVWIGHADDRRAWDLLGDARDALAGGTRGAASRRRRWSARGEAYRAACGSDWCWWYGDDHSSENDVEFDRLFRRHLRAVYARARAARCRRSSGDADHDAPRRGAAEPVRASGHVQPQLDGEITSADEWARRGLHRVGAAIAMGRAGHGLRQVRFGTSDGRFHVLLETSGLASDLLAGAELAVVLPAASRRCATASAAAPRSCARNAPAARGGPPPRTRGRRPTRRWSWPSRCPSCRAARSRRCSSGWRCCRAGSSWSAIPRRRPSP